MEITWDKALIAQENHYYPFGMNMVGIEKRGMPEDRFQYNGKEKQEEFGLNWADYGARFYDATLGRFFTQDRFAEKYYDFTPYQYGANNPIKYIDVNGDSLWIQIGSNENNRALYINGQVYNSDGKTIYSGKGIKKDGALNGFLKKTVNTLNQIRNTTATGNGLVKDLQHSDNNFVIKRSHNGNSDNGFIADNEAKAAANLSEFKSTFTHLSKNGSGGTIIFNPNSTLGGFDENGNRERPSFIGLAHELFHASDANFGILYPQKDFSSPVTGVNYISTIDGLLKAEISAVNQENQLRLESAIPLRAYYGVHEGKPVNPNLIPFFLRTATYLYR